MRLKSLRWYLSGQAAPHRQQALQPPRRRRVAAPHRALQMLRQYLSSASASYSCRLLTVPGRRQQPGPTRQPPQPPLPAALPDSVSWGRGGMTRSGFRHDRMLFVENGYDFSQVPPPPPQRPPHRAGLSLRFERTEPARSLRKLY